MQLKSFEAGRYDDESIVVSNPANGKQELFSEREYAIVKFLKQNEKQSLLALLMPNIGIAKRSHVEMCLRVLSKLRRMEIADYFSITGRPRGNTQLTNTLELDIAKVRFELTSLNALAATIFGISGKVLAPLGGNGLLIGSVMLAALSFVLFPFDSVDVALHDSGPPYTALFCVAYLTGCLAMSARAIAQAAYLKSFGRESGEQAVGLVPPFVTLSSNTTPVNLLGFKARVQMAVLGLCAPFALSLFYSLLALGHLMNPVQAFVGFAASAGTSLFLLCPLLPFDGAAIVQSLLFRNELGEKVAMRLREIFQTKGSYPREMLIAIGITLGWLFVWLDCLRAFRDTLGPRLAIDFFEGSALARAGAVTTTLAVVALIFMPVVLVAVHLLRMRARHRRKRVVVQKDKVNESLTFEERIAALEKIPLFAYLNDQERLALQNEMQPAFYKHGDFLMHQGEVGKEFFVLVKGHATALHTDVQGRTNVLSDFAEGDAFGEIALIDDVPRRASIVSEGGCIVLVLRKDGFDHFAESLGSPDRVKAMVRLTSFFRRHPLFSKLGARDQAQLIDSFRFQTITPGEQIPDGDERFHVIYSGSVRVDTGGADGETTLQNDDCFGYSNPLRARYVALEGTGLLTVAKDEFHNLIWEKLVSKPELFV